MGNEHDNDMRPADGSSPPGLPPSASAVEPVAPSDGAAALAHVDPPARLSWERWAADKGVPTWKAEAARHGRAWPIGQEVTEDDFNQALYDAFNARIG